MPKAPVKLSPAAEEDAKARRLADLVARRGAVAAAPAGEAEASPADAPGRRNRKRKVNLTDKRMAEIATRDLARRLEIADATMVGLTARVAPGGRITFTYRWRADGGFRRVNLDAATVAEAREKASQAKGAAGIGRDPRATSAAHQKATARTVADTVPDYIEALRQRGRAESYRTSVARMFALHVTPLIGRKRLVDLTRADLANLYARVAASRSAKAKGAEGTLAAMPNRVHAQVTALLGWAEQVGRIPPGTVPVLSRPVAEEPSARALREESKVLLRPEHVAWIWRAVEGEPGHVRRLVRLLCLLPMRREELTQLAWPEVRSVLPDDNLRVADAELFQGPRLELAAARMKGRRPQIMPLPPLAVALLREGYEDRGEDGPHVFSASAGRKPYAGWRTLADRLRDMCPGLPAGWVVHDIRGGIATAMGEAGEEESVIARLLHHAPAARIGVTSRYDRSRRLRPMLEALERWEAALLKAVAVEERREAQLPAGGHGAGA